MNARIYDPVLARFLSPDPMVQAPDFTQSFNRYSYCWNNPFKYTDPSGESLVGAILIAGGISLAADLVSTALSDGGIESWSLHSGISSTVEGMISGGVTYGIGSLFGSVGSFADGTFDIANELGRAGTHAIANGLINEAFGGDFGLGFISGALGSFTGSITHGAGLGDNLLVTTSTSMIVSGIGAELAGGDFWEGAHIS